MNHSDMYRAWKAMMRGQAGLRELDERYDRLGALGNPPEKPNAIIVQDDFDRLLTKVLKRSHRAKGGRAAKNLI